MTRHAWRAIRPWHCLTIAALLIPGCRSKDGRYFVPNPFGPPIEVTDLIPPSIQNIRPSSNIFLNDNGFSFDVIDAGSGVDLSRVRAQLSEQNLPLTRGVANTWNADAGAIVEGTLTTVNLEAYDLKGNRGAASLTFTKDLTGPTVTFNGPTTGSSTQSTAQVNFTGTYADPAGISAAAYYVRRAVNGQCSLTGELFPTGSGPGTVSQNQFPLGTSGAYNINLTLNAPNDPRPQTWTVCWHFHGEDGARDRNGNARSNPTDRFWKLDYTWSVPQPAFGTVTGRVTLNNTQPISGLTVTVAGRTTTTDTDGRYTFTGIPEGTQTVSLANIPSSVQCVPASKGTEVVGGQTATVNFNCTAIDFSVNLQMMLVHVGPGVSYACVRGTATETAFKSAEPIPLEALTGATWTVSWSGPGTVGSTQRNGPLDANNQMFDRQQINAFGTYTATVAVTANGLTKQATGTITVGAAQGTCPPP